MKPVIFFDWDGTLADSMNLCVAEIRQALITMRLPDLPDDVLRQCNGPTFEQSLDILHIPHDRAQEYMTTRLTAELALVPTVNRLFPGVREMLQTLREYADLCIVSNGEHDYIALCLQVFGLTDVFVRTATSVPGRTKGENLRALLDDLRPERAVWWATGWATSAQVRRTACRRLRRATDTGTTRSTIRRPSAPKAWRT